jgi:hypothetical protein
MRYGSHVMRGFAQLPRKSCKERIRKGWSCGRNAPDGKSVGAIDAATVALAILQRNVSASRAWSLPLQSSRRFDEVAPKRARKVSACASSANEKPRRVFDQYLRLAARRKQPAKVLSGGERRSLEISRGAGHGPQGAAAVDEPSIGLEPRLSLSAPEESLDRDRAGHFLTDRRRRHTDDIGLRTRHMPQLECRRQREHSSRMRVTLRCNRDEPLIQSKNHG